MRGLAHAFPLHKKRVPCPSRALCEGGAFGGPSLPARLEDFGKKFGDRRDVPQFWKEIRGQTGRSPIFAHHEMGNVPSVPGFLPPTAAPLAVAALLKVTLMLS